MPWKFFQGVGLKAKFLLLVSFLLVIFSVSITTRVISTTKNIVENELKEKGMAIARNLAYNAVYGILVEDSEVLNNFITGIMIEKDVSYAMILDKDRNVLGHSDNAEVGKNYSDELTKHSMGQSEAAVTIHTDGSGVDYYDISVPVLNKATSEGRSTEQGALIGIVRLGVSKNDINRTIKGLVGTGVIVSLIIFAVGIVIAIYMVELMIVPVKDMAVIAQKIAAGDFTKEIVISSNDEVGLLGSAFSKMEQNLKSMISKIRDVSKSLTSVSEEIFVNSTKVQDGAGIQAASAEQTASSVEEMNAAIREINESVEVLSSAAEESSSAVLELSSSISEVVNSTGKLSISVEETTSSIIEMSTSIRQVAENVEILTGSAGETSSAINKIDKSLTEVVMKAKDSAEFSRKATNDAEELGMKSIDRTIQGMKRIKSTVELATEVIGRLGERSKHIGKVLTVIDEVTKQTNLLALNAAILAAQAGEQGKGFAVVADEIKNLANRTDASTKEIAVLIADVQNETADAVDSIKQGTLSVEEGMVLSLEAGEALKKILESSKKSTDMAVAIEAAIANQLKEIATVSDAVKKVSSMTIQISKATHEQKKGAAQIMSASENMRDIAKHVSRTTEEQARTSRQINVAVENVTSRIGQIAKAIREQKRGSEIIMKSIRNINDISQESVQLSANMTKTINVLSRVAEILKDEINKFKIE